MDENDQELQELNLEDIMREFGGSVPDGQAAGEAPAAGEETKKPAPEESETVPAEEPAGEPPAEEAAAAPEEPAPQEEEDTVRIEDGQLPHGEAPAPDMDADTVKVELGESENGAEEAPQDVTPAEEAPEAETQAEEAPAEKAPEAETVSENPPAGEAGEAFSGDWEPEYEEPMGTYIPPQPIIFHPRSRLRELKRQLIAGPEKRYYELSEQGTGKLQIAILLSLVLVLLSAGSTVLYAMDLVGEDRLRLLVFGQFFAMLLSALLGSFRLVDGITDLFHGRFTLNTMLVFTFLACCADGVMGLMELRVPCCAAFSLEMTMSLWSEYEKRTTEMGQMDTMRKAVRLDSLVDVPDYFDGKPGILRGEGRVEDFMDHYDVPSRPEKLQGIYALIALLVSLGAGIVAGLMHGVSFGIQVAAVSTLAAVPASFFVTLTRPKAVLERRLHRLGTVLCGWQGVERLCGKKAFPLTSSDLFPSGAVKMNGVKFYGSRDTDEVVAYAAALISADEGGLAPLFTQLLDSRNGRHYEVETPQVYNGGIGGEVNGEPVVMGVLSLMKDMGVEVPEGTRVNQAVYIAIDGELCGLFAFTYEKTRTAAAGIATLCAYRSLKPVLITNDFMLTNGFIRGKFGVNSKRIAFPDRAARAELSKVEPEKEKTAMALTTQEGLASLAFAVTGARALRTASVFGLAVHILGGVIGLALMVLMAVLGASHVLTPFNMFLYQLVWMIPGLLVTEWARTV